MEPLANADPRRLGAFQVHAVLGSGGMGRVYYGQSRTGEEVALKVIRPDLLDDAEARLRFGREAEALQAVVGGRVAHFVAADAVGDQPWIAIEYVPGPTLRSHVQTAGTLTLPSVAILGAVLAEGLETIHRCRLLHRDLKPHNIILGPDGPKVIDFGLAVLEECRMELTATGMPVGTPVCMPPEQARGERELTPAADVYALGASLVFAAIGRFPYQAVNSTVILELVRDPAVQPNLDGIPNGLRDVLSAMLAHAATDRPPLTDVVTALLDVVESEGLTAIEARAALIAQTSTTDDARTTVAGWPRTLPLTHEYTPAGTTVVVDGESLLDEDLLSPVFRAIPPSDPSGPPTQTPADVAVLDPAAMPIRTRVAERLRRAYARDAEF